MTRETGKYNSHVETQPSYLFSKGKYFPIVSYSINYVENNMLNKIILTFIKLEHGFSKLEEAKKSAENDYGLALDACKTTPANKLNGATIEWLAQVGYRMLKEEDEHMPMTGITPMSS